MSGQLLRIEGYILETGSTGRYRDKVGHPTRTAQLTPTGSQAPDTSGFLTRPDLLHLDTHPERFGQHFNQLAKIDPLVGNVIEDGLITVSLIFDIADLHIQMQIFGNLTGSNHRIMLFRLSFFEFFQVIGFGFPIDTL